MEIALSWLALCLYAAGGLFRAPRVSISMYMTANLFYVAFYLIIGNYTPAICITGNSLCGLAMLVVPQRALKPLLIFSLAVTSTAAMQSVNHMIDMILIPAGWLIMWSNYRRDDYVQHKIAVMCSQLIWVVFCIHYSDWPMLICCIAVFVTNSWGLWSNIRKDRMAGIEQPDLPIGDIAAQTRVVAPNTMTMLTPLTAVPESREEDI